MLSLISKVSFLCLTQDCFFFLILSQYLINRGISVSQISFLLMIKKISQILTEVPFGFLFEKFNPKILFIASRSLKIVSMLMLFYFTDTKNLIIASIIGGFAVSSLFSKIDVYIYNSLEEKGRVDMFPKAVAMYYFITDFMVVWMHYISGVLIENATYFQILKVSILFISLSFPIILTIDNRKLNNINTGKSASLSLIDIKLKIADIKREIKRKEILLSMILLGFLNGFIWQIIGLINLILKYNQKSLIFVTDGNISKISSMLFLLMSAGSFVTMFVKKFNLKTGMKIIPIMFGVMFIGVFNIHSFIISISLIMLFYTFAEICIERFLDAQITKSVRASCFSVISVILALFQITTYAIFGSLSKMFNPNYAIKFYALFCLIIFSSLIFALSKVRIDKNI